MSVICDKFKSIRCGVRIANWGLEGKFEMVSEKGLSETNPPKQKLRGESISTLPQRFYKNF